jgi:outer membrane protein assembly factor BamB
MNVRKMIIHCRSGIERPATFAGFAWFLLVCSASHIAIAEDWTTYRSNRARTGVTRDSLSPNLSLQWRFTPIHVPKPAWPPPGEELPRMHFDNAYHVTSSDGIAYFGTSTSDKVYAVDVSTGNIVWSFFADGPVRFAPDIYKGNVYFGSDDGYVYCLDAKNGNLIWKYRAGWNDEKVIGNGRMISAWPVRTSVLVDEGEVFFGAGVFPYEGIYICALRAEDGSVIWKNDTIGDYGQELLYGGITPQSYIVASRDMVYVPSGRAMPVVFDRKTGKYIYYAWSMDQRGGTWALLDDDKLVAGVERYHTSEKFVYDAKTGDRIQSAFAWFKGIDMVPTREMSYVLTAEGVYALDRQAHAKATAEAKELSGKRSSLENQSHALKEKLEEAGDQETEGIKETVSELERQIMAIRKEKRQLRKTSYAWQYTREELSSMILAGQSLFVGGQGVVLGIDIKSGEEFWKADVTGTTVSLAAAGGRLFVSSTAGPIYCFGPSNVSAAKEIGPTLGSMHYPTENIGSLYKRAAEKIVKETGIEKGYCLVLDCGEGRLAYELAKRTELQIVGLEKDKEKLAKARRHLESAGLLGSRVAIEPWDIESLPDYFANLVVSDEMLVSGQTSIAKEEIDRVTRPYGGVSLLGSQPEGGGEIVWAKTVRGKLEDAGSWTQLYGNPENTASSGDRLVKGPFGLLWYGEPGSAGMYDRHARNMCPLSMNGRLFIERENGVLACDAYNGTRLWETTIPGVVRVRTDADSGNMCLTEDSLYVATKDKCYRLDVRNGEIIRTYECVDARDGGKRRWGFLSCKDGVLYGVGALAVPAGHFMGSHLLKGRDIEFPEWGTYSTLEESLVESALVGDVLFAMDTDSGGLLWRYDGGKIPNISVSIADGKVFFCDGVVSQAQRREAAQNRDALIEKGAYLAGPESQIKDADRDVRLLVALDAKSGDAYWKKPVDLTGCGSDKMGSAYGKGVLLFFGNFSNHDGEAFLANELAWRRVMAVNGATGRVRWSRSLNYRRRVLILDDKIIVEPKACDLYTGEVLTRQHPVTGLEVPREFLRPGRGCGIASASADTLFYRSSHVVSLDFSGDRGISNFGAVRPGCWINMITAGGLMLMPEASAGCTCSYPLRCSLALVPKPRRAMRNWTTFITQGQMTPVKHLAVNFGAPGDMKDDNGRVWFAYPRPVMAMADYLRSGGPPDAWDDYYVKLNLKEEIKNGTGFYCSDFKGVRFKGTDRPWLFTSGCLGLASCELPLIDAAAGQEPAKYTVRLGFKPNLQDVPGDRIFDIGIQNDVVLDDFSIMEETGSHDTVVIKEFKKIDVKDVLALKLVPKNSNPQTGQVPLINFIEVVRE